MGKQRLGPFKKSGKACALGFQRSFTGVCHACGWPKDAHKPARVKPKGTGIKGYVRRAV